METPAGIETPAHLELRKGNLKKQT